MKTYQMIGRPAGAPVDVLTDHSIGDTFEAKLDPELEDLLIGGGALRIIEQPKPEKQEKPKPVEKETPRASSAAKPAKPAR